MADTVTDEWLTIPEAAALVGLSERTLYRVLKTGNNAARTKTEHRRTATGNRLTTLVPLDLAQELKATHGTVSAEPDAANDAATTPPDSDRTPANGDNNAANTGRTLTDGDNADTEETEPEPEAEAPAPMPLVVYQHRIADLETQNAELRRDKERLYSALQLAQENLKREQSLRLIGVERAQLETPAEAPSEAPTGPLVNAEAPGSPETDATPAKASESEGGNAGNASEGQKSRPWWQWWGRKE